MTRTIAVIDPQLMRDIFEQTRGDVISRMQQAAAILMGQGMNPAGMEALLQRMQALHELLYAHPELSNFYSEKALISACALCELNEPPISLVTPDHVMFELKAFKHEASRAEL